MEKLKKNIKTLFTTMTRSVVAVKGSWCNAVRLFISARRRCGDQEDRYILHDDEPARSPVSDDRRRPVVGEDLSAGRPHLLAVHDGRQTTAAQVCIVIDHSILSAILIRGKGKGKGAYT